MSKATDVLDDLAKSERRRSRRYFFIGAAIVITILLGGFLGTAGETKQVEGTVRSLYGRPHDLGENLYLLVTLDDGRDVKVFLHQKLLS